MAKSSKIVGKGKPIKRSEGTYPLDGKEIPYVLFFKSVKNFNLRVRADGSLHISVPHGTKEQRVWHFVSDHSDFLRGALARVEQRQRTEEQIDISEEIPRLRAMVTEMLPRMGERIVSAAQDLYGISRESICGGTPLFPNARFALAPNEIRYRDMKSRWGSCAASKGSLTLNSRLIFTTADCLEYVICHELCHFFYPNHGKAFHALLQAVLPDAPQRRRKLNGK